ncbi:excinuclease ABC subunit UvrB [Desulfosarcina ovata]|uniref:UvrABC system protein B n=2 Tax=Desulfosarcina ovata TaxID=83564 RepID=A0A5K8A4Q5_9BACT|nr:excinuclease ABC subunit UvrB [Desulfosarcina ovata]BBO80083.1 UvrABC system protein B [Desulfosarcina ovata subsp. sediminis]BBO87398.1 UvrABC system protein B [Desulfosarcina ovata subsp. ovata]
MSSFKLVSDFTPCGDQPQAIDILSRKLMQGVKSQVLLGVTGSGKTFTVANIIARVNRPALILAPNKTLAAQLFNEFRHIFPENAVEYFVSYYDYYQPEAYLPTTDTYIQKDSSINEMIDKMRHSATRNVLSRSDVIVVASVSCIYGLGAPEDYLSMRIDLAAGMDLPRERLLYQLVSIHYQRNDMDFHRGVFRVRGDRVEIFPAYEEDKAVRIDFFGDEIETIQEFDPLTGTTQRSLESVAIFPASHYVTRKATLERAAHTIVQEMKERVEFFRQENCLIEAQRIEERTRFDLEMIQEIGYCNGIENYSRHLTGRTVGQPPPTLLDYFPKDFLIFVDESHIAIPQIQAMYKGDRSRKETLVKYGFRLPSALDNRPLKFDEWSARVHQIVYVSATPADYEKDAAAGQVVEQIVRPTGLIDPVIHVRSARNQVDDLYQEIRQRQERGERILVTTLTKRMAEDLSEYYTDLGLSVRYLHSDITTMERMDIIRDLRMGKFDALIGINLLREGLDIPEVSLVAILDADKEGFLRSTRSLIQTFGRAARNAHGTVLLYADRMTASMQQAIEETDRRRSIQETYNRTHQITPRTIHKNITDIFDMAYAKPEQEKVQVAEAPVDFEDMETIEATIEALETQMQAAAKELAFEKAAQIRDRIKVLRKRLLFEA